ncbi:GRB10-interacting GYF protein 2-like [Littorina saxatilis]|uniref:GRB10-interacting GYF protein 2-like n=1 Tax=Littorina saxatilis TaxID=31220 RepID=UPI0038B567B9
MWKCSHDPGLLRSGTTYQKPADKDQEHMSTSLERESPRGVVVSPSDLRTPSSGRGRILQELSKSAERAKKDATRKKAVAGATMDSSVEDQLWAKYQEHGTSFGLSGSALLTYVTQQVQTELQRLREKEERERESDRRERLRQEDIERQNEIRRQEREDRQREFDRQEALRRDEIRRLEDAREQETAVLRGLVESNKSKDDYKVILKKWDESQDIDFFLLNFERVAVSHGWKQDRWAVRIADQLTGRAQQAYLRLTPEEAGQYETIKKTLLEEYRKTPDNYRRTFRELKKMSDESFKQFVKRQRLYFERWISTSEIARTYEAICDLILLEQFLANLTGELATHVREKKPQTAVEAADIAFQHVEARREARIDMGQPGLSGAKSSDKGRSSFKGQGGRNYQRSNRDKSEADKTSSKPDNASSGQDRASGGKDEKLKGSGTSPDTSQTSTRPSGWKPTCHKCHKQGHYKRECPARFDAIQTMEKQPEDLWSEMTPLCEKCERIPFERNCKVRVNGKVCWAMRDTGADDICVKPELVNPEDYTGATEKVVLAVLKISGDYPKALIDMYSAFVSTMHRHR